MRAPAPRAGATRLPRRRTRSLAVAYNSGEQRRYAVNTSVEAARAVLSTTPERWQRLASALPAYLLTQAPASGEWSALRCLQHLVDAERVNFPVRLQAFLAG